MSEIERNERSRKHRDDEMTEYAGSCHCGAIGFSYSTGIRSVDWPIRACQCSFCRAHNALSTSDPSGKLRFFADDASRMQRYRFGLKTADFIICDNCGVYVGAVIETERGTWGIINTHALVDVPADIADVLPMDYDGEDQGSRILRREQRWTPATIE